MLLLLIVIFLVWPSADPERKILNEIKRHKINKIYMYICKRAQYVEKIIIYLYVHNIHNIYTSYIHGEAYTYFLYYFTKNT